MKITYFLFPMLLLTFSCIYPSDISKQKNSRDSALFGALFLLNGHRMFEKGNVQSLLKKPSLRYYVSGIYCGVFGIGHCCNAVKKASSH